MRYYFLADSRALRVVSGRRLARRRLFNLQRDEKGGASQGRWITRRFRWRMEERDVRPKTRGGDTREAA